MSGPTNAEQFANAAKRAKHKDLPPLDYFVELDARRREAQRINKHKERSQDPIEILSESEFDGIPAAQWIVPGLILESSLGLVVGEPGSLKTFTILDLALSIASGQPTWLGRSLRRHGPVVYVVAEGQGRFKYRKNVWKQQRGIVDYLPFHIVRKPVDLRNADLMGAFLQKIVALKPVLIVFDTLSRCIPGGEENSAKEYGEAIAACNALQQATGATVQLLHHPTKNGESARGSGAGLGAVESELWLKKTSDRHLFELSIGKMKEGDDEGIIPLKKRVIELDGVFEDGEPVTSCVVELATEDDLKKATESLDTLVWTCIERNPGIQRDDVVQKIGKRAKDVRATIDELIKSGRVKSTKRRPYQLTVAGEVVNPDLPY